MHMKQQGLAGREVVLPVAIVQRVSAHHVAVGRPAPSAGDADNTDRRACSFVKLAGSTNLSC